MRTRHLYWILTGPSFAVYTAVSLFQVVGPRVPAAPLTTARDMPQCAGVFCYLDDHHYYKNDHHTMIITSCCHSNKYCCQTIINITFVIMSITVTAMIFTCSHADCRVHRNFNVILNEKILNIHARIMILIQLTY